MSSSARKSQKRPLGDEAAADYAVWRESVESGLGGETFDDALTFTTRDGLVVEPLYAAESVAGLELAPPPGTPPYTRGTRAEAGWRIGQEITCPPTAEAVETMRAGQRRGVDLLWLRFVDAGAIAVEELVAAVEPGTEVVLDIGAGARVLASGWLAASRQLDLRPAGCFGCDPLTRAVAAGRYAASLEDSLGETAELAACCVAEAPGMRSVLVSGTRLHNRGATPVQELAFAIAAGVEYLRRLTAAGLTVDQAAGQVDFTFSIGRDFFGEIARLRAARLLWSKVVGAAGGGKAAQAMRLHARTSRVEASRLDPWMNLLRGGAQSFAAAVGGAESIVCAAHDQVLGAPGERGRRLAVGVQHILDEEAQVGRVVDPAGGSWYLESLTDALARAAWRELQILERRGGMAGCVRNGIVPGLLAAAAADRRWAVAEGLEPVIGASVYVDPGEALPATSDGEPAGSPEPVPFRLAEPFERQRRKSDGSRSSREARRLAGEPA